MLITLTHPLRLDISTISDFLPHSKLESDSILEEKTSKKILSFHKKESSEEFDAIETDFTAEELGTLLSKVESYRNKKVILALGKAGFELPQLYKTALANNEVDLVELLLQKRADPNEKNHYGTSYLIEAIKDDREKLALLLVQYGADLTQWSKDYPPDTPLMLAAWKKQSRVVDAILEKKVDPSFVGPVGQTALYAAIYGGSSEIVNKLLSFEKVDVNQSCQGTSLLAHAVKKGHLEIVQTLLSRKADIELGEEELTPLIIALQEEQLEIADLLIDAKADCMNPLVLGYAARYSNIKLIQKILDKKVDVDTSPEDQATPLMVATSSGQLEVVRKFLSLGANHGASEKEDGLTAMHLASREGHDAIIQLLIAKNAEVDKECKKGSPLVLALINNHPKTLDILLQHGASINVKMPTGKDLLTFAAEKQFAECIDVLMKYKAPFSKIDPYRLMDQAFHEGNKATFNALLQHDEKEIKNYLYARRKTPLKRVNLSEVKKGSSYSLMLKNTYKECQLRIVQREWRKKHPSEKKVKYEEILKGPLSLRFIQEPIGFAAESHAKKIKAGQWLTLDFKEKEFSRNLFKALRQERITINEMSTADALYHFNDLMRDEKRNTHLRQHDFSLPGPYFPTHISYAQQYQLENFANALLSLPLHERCYFSIDCSRIFEMIFLCYGLEIYQKAIQVSQFQTFLTKFIDKLKVSESEKKDLLKDIETLKEDDTNNLASLRLRVAVLNHYPDLKHLVFEDAWYKDTRITSAKLMLATFAVGDQNPYFEISPDYDENNPNSPLLCHIILTTSAMNALQLAMHGNDSTFPFFTAGQFSPRLIRELDEHPERVGFHRHARPVEFPHPDLESALKTHGYRNVHPAANKAHDFPFHGWRNGALTIKPMIRYLRKLHESVKGYDMSKYIWFLTDMDMSAGWSARNRAKSNYIWERKSYWINRILEEQNGKLQDCNNDALFISLIDMLQNENQWIQFVGQIPTKHFENESKVIQFMEAIKKIMKEYQNLPVLFYIVAYRLLGDMPTIDAKEILKELSEDPSLLSKMFYWDRNGGVRFKSTFDSDMHGKKLESLQIPDMIRYCQKYLNYHFDKNRRVKIDSSQPFLMFEFGNKLSSG